MRRIAVLSLLILLLASGKANAGPASVGAVTLKLGEAWIVAASGMRRGADAGAPVYAGEALETAASGHLHVRFVDGGVVSVRPGGRLVIDDYRDPAEGGGIRFRLERGAIRSVTGQWGEARRERFRLNTPIAAIGIQGTDFVAESREDATRIAVNSGGVIAAPIGAECRAEDYGPCGGGQARLLTAAMGSLMLEIRRGDPTPAIVPRNGLAAARDAEAVAAVRTLKSEDVTLSLARQALAAEPPPPAALVWGRWAHAPAWPGDDLAVSSEEAAAGRERVAENGRYALYRLPQSGPLPASGAVTLGLAASQVHLIQPNGVLPAQALDGWLSLDFAARRFATALTLESAPTGRIPFAAAGGIRPDGAFSAIEFRSRVEGAHGGSGGGAAYLFEHSVPQGMFMGITRWR